jgi:hypothetical protein
LNIAQKQVVLSFHYNVRAQETPLQLNEELELQAKERTAELDAKTRNLNG